ncbi:hypothetical protein [Sphingomonas gellani]|uniref:hypothetical protein n=1 Tax=Sphingomonas gellani TaxID=1166340 RepID=UPI001FCCC7FB|nr:hypothetical protein [Sphingomonas gellani]
MNINALRRVVSIDEADRSVPGNTPSAATIRASSQQFRLLFLSEDYGPETRM